MIVDDPKCFSLTNALRGRKAYRHFKDELNRLSLKETYYAFRLLAFVEIARGWCEDYGIPYQTRSIK